MDNGGNHNLGSQSESRVVRTSTIEFENVGTCKLQVNVKFKGTKEDNRTNEVHYT